MPGTWPKRMLFVVGVIFLASYFGLISFAGVEEALAYLATRSDATQGMFTNPGGRGEALYVLFAFLFLTPIAGVFALILPLFASAVFADVMRRALRVPEILSTLVFFVAVGIIAWMTRASWTPSAEWFLSVLAHALLVGFGLGA